MRLLDKTNEKEKEEYTSFLQNHPRCNFQQSIEWATVKNDNWEYEVIIAEDEKKQIKGTLMVFIRKMPIFGNMMYSSRGPVCDIYDKDSLQQIRDGAKMLAKKYNSFVLRIEPDILKSDEEFRKNITDLGFKIKDDAKDFMDEIQPRFVFRLDIKGKTKDEVFSNFASKTRYNIRLATKKGVEVKKGTKEDLKDFHEIMVVTGKRDKFITRPLSYFEKMYDSLGDHMELLMAYHDGKPISGVIPIYYGNKTWYLYGASSNEHRNLMPNYLLQWTMIQKAIDRKDDIYDFRGVSGVVDENHPQYGLYRFKKSFGAEFTEFIGEVYYPFKPLKYKLYKIAEKTFRNLRQLKTNIKEKLKGKN